MSTLRPMRQGDLDDVLDLQREGAVRGLGHIFPQATHPFPTAEVRARWLEEIHDPRVDCFVIVSGGGVEGFAAIRGEEFLHFGTAVTTWGAGLAGRAHDDVLAHFRSRGYSRGWLRVFEENTRAVAFYTRRGWVATGETSRTTFPPHPVLQRYERDLQPSAK